MKQGATTEPRAHLPSYAMLASAAVLWGCWTLSFRPAERLQPVSPAMESFVVFAVTLVVLGPAAWRDGRGRERSPAAWAWMCLLGLADAGNVLCYFASLQRTSVAVAAITHYLAPVLVAIAEPVLLRTRPQRSPWPSVLLATLGIVLVSEPWKSAAAANLAGAGLGAASAVFYAGNIMLSKRLHADFSQREIQAWHVAPGLLVLLWFVPRGGWAIGAAPLSILVAGALLMGVLGGWLFLRGLKQVAASHAAVLCLIEPVVGVAVGAIAWKELPGPVSLVGAALVLLAAWRVMR